MSLFQNKFRNIMRLFGVDIVRCPKGDDYKFPPDFDNAGIELIKAVKPFTMTSPERIFALCEAVKYVVGNDIPGDIVECGVWKGGSMRAVAQTLVDLKSFDKKLYLFDTFEGMSAPTEADVSIDNKSASSLLRADNKDKESSVWCFADVDSVKAVVNSVGYPADKIHYIKGMVEQTIPANAPSSISLLRLDTDWYESTKHELIHLYPRISPNGVLIIDDYGHWKGARKAVDEYIKENKIKLLLNRIDYTGRIGVKAG
jgi:O-methyltransferase